MSKIEEYNDAKRYAEEFAYLAKQFSDIQAVPDVFISVDVNRIAYGNRGGTAMTAVCESMRQAVEEEVVNNVRLLVEKAAARAIEEAKRKAREAISEAREVLEGIDQEEEI